MIRTIGFDWDGTLVDSMGVKARAFAQSVVKYYPNLAGREKDIEAHYVKTRGTPRFDQLKWLQEQWNLSQLSQEEQQAWSDFFTSLYSQEKLPLFDDVLPTLQGLKEQGKRLWLGSSVPEVDLRQTLTQYPELENVFDFVLGSRQQDNFRKGKPYLEYVSQQVSVPVSEIAFVGDAADDITGAKEAGAFAVGIVRNVPGAREELTAAKPDLLVDSLRELLEKL